MVSAEPVGTIEPRRQCIPDDAIVDLGVDGALVERDAGAAGSPGLGSFTESLNHVGFSRAGLVLQGDQEAAFGRAWPGG